jgi:hypothetical protein
MKQKIRVYLTTRTDPVPDLDDMKTAADLGKWKKDVKPHALEIREFPGPVDDMISFIGEHPILECYAVISYPPGKMEDADDSVGEPLLGFLKKNAEQLNWQLDETGQSATTVAEQAEKSFDQVYGEVRGKNTKPSAGGGGGQPRLDASHLWDNFTYGLIADKKLGADEYEVDLEVVTSDQ